MKTICWLLWLVLPGAAMAAHTLAAGSRLVQGLHLKSPNGAYQLEMQTDRNLVLYDVSQTPAQDRRVVWDIKKSDTSRAWACALVMQKDGNLVTYVRPDDASSWNQYFGVGEPYWKTETNGIYGEGDYLLTLRDDGVLEVTLPVLDYNATVWKAGKGVDETRFANAMDDIATTVLSRYKSRIETLVDKDNTFEAAATIKTLLAGTRDQKELRKAIERLSQQVVAAESAIGRAQNPLTAQPSKPGSASPLPLPPAPSPSPSAPEIKGEPSYSFTAAWTMSRGADLS